MFGAFPSGSESDTAHFHPDQKLTAHFHPDQKPAARIFTPIRKGPRAFSPRSERDRGRWQAPHPVCISGHNKDAVLATARRLLQPFPVITNVLATARLHPRRHFRCLTEWHCTIALQSRVKMPFPKICSTILARSTSKSDKRQFAWAQLNWLYLYEAAINGIDLTNIQFDVRALLDPPES
jgi:hypothetical protein